MTKKEYFTLIREIAETEWVNHVISDSMNPSDLEKFKEMKKLRVEFEEEHPEYAV